MHEAAQVRRKEAHRLRSVGVPAEDIADTLKITVRSVYRLLEST